MSFAMTWRSALTCSILCFLLSLTISATFVKLAEAEPIQRKAGVKAGDFVKYGNFLALWDSINPGAQMPEQLTEHNNTLWTTNTVLNVSGTSVTYETKTHYRNETEKSIVAEVDVKTGMGRGNLSFVSADLVAGDRVYTIGDFSIARINSTLPRAYAGITRPTNLLNVTNIVVDLQEAYWNEFFWDKTTGILVEQFWSYAAIDENGYLTQYSFEYTMVDNNIWFNVPDDVPPIADAGSDQTVELGVAVTFDAGMSSDNIGIARFLWSFGDGASGNGMKVTHTYERAGVFNVTLTVEDAEGNSSVDAVIVTVKEGPSSQLPLWLTGITVFLVILAILWFLLRRK